MRTYWMTGLVLAVAGCSPAAPVAAPRAAQPPSESLEERVARLEAMGCNVKTNNGKIVKIELLDWQAQVSSPETLQRILECRDVEVLLITTPVADDAFVQRALRLPRLRTLYVQSKRVGDEGLRGAAEAEHLQAFAAFECAVTDRGARYLQDVPKLEIVGFFNTPVTDEQLAAMRAARPELNTATFEPDGCLHARFTSYLSVAEDHRRNQRPVHGP